MHTRELQLDLAGIRKESETIPATIATSTPVDRGSFLEVLDCRPQGVDLSREPLPVLVSHDRERLAVGVAEGLRADGDRVRASIRFGSSAEAIAIRRDVIAGIHRSLSVGYEILDDGVRIDEKSRRFRWRPFEVSITPVPADPNAGFFRNKEYAMDQNTEQHNDQHMSRSQRRAAGRDAVSERERTVEILAIADECVRIGYPRARELAAQYIADGKSIEEFRADVAFRALEAQSRRQSFSVPSGENLNERELVADDASSLGLTARDVSRYSLLRAIGAMVSNDWSRAGFEREVTEAMRKKLGRNTDRLVVPLECMGIRQGRRDMTVASATGGGNLVQTDVIPTDFLVALRQQSRVMQLGARFIPGLVGNVNIPKAAGSVTTYWQSTEATAITESQMSISQFLLSPKSCGAYTELSRKLLMQTSGMAEDVVRMDMTGALAEALDKAAVAGSGSGGEPTGLKNASVLGVENASGAALSFDHLVNLELDVLAASGDQADSIAYLTTPAAFTYLKKKKDTTNRYLWEVNNGNRTGAPATVNGYPIAWTKHLSGSEILMGPWSRIIIGQWNALEIEVNPYANFPAGIVGVRAFMDVDVAADGVYFSMMNDAVLT